MSKLKIYDFTSGLKAARQKLAPEEPVPEPPPLTPTLLPRPVDSEVLVARADKIVVADLKAVSDLTYARTVIEQAMEALDRDLANIKSQIELAKGHAANGQYSDPHWWSRVNYVAKTKGGERQRLQNKYGVINRRLRAESGISRERMFIDVAKRHLSPETFYRLWQLVDSEVQHHER